MKSYFLFLFFVLFSFCSCPKRANKENSNIVVCDTDIVNNQNVMPIQKENNVNLDSIKKVILKSQDKLQLLASDTIKYQFSLEDVGTEGNEGTAYYLKDSIRQIEIGIGTSMMIYDLLYVFEKPYIIVTEQTYNITNVYSGGERELTKTLSYSTDWNGIPINNVDTDRVDIFQELKEAVPFVLK